MCNINCKYCSDIKANSNEFPNGCGIMFEKTAGQHYFVTEYFKGEITLTDIKYCPECGLKLKNE